MEPIERFPGSLRFTTLVNWTAGLKPKTPMSIQKRANTPNQATTTGQMCSSASLEHTFLLFLPGGYRPPDPPPWKFEFINSVLKLIKLYQASELVLDFWILSIKSYQASELILDFGIFHENSDISYIYIYFLFGPRFWIIQA